MRLSASGRAGVFCHRESPKSPRTQPPISRKKRSYSGSFSPSVSRMFSRISGATSEGSMSLTGSPTACTMKKTKIRTPMTTRSE